MLGWLWKKNEGFEWREYVRTTILVRRKRRQDQVAEVKAAAVAGLEKAGRKGVAAGAKGLTRAGFGLASGMASLGRLPGWIGSRMAPALTPLARRIDRSNLTGPLLLMGVVGLCGALLRTLMAGPDGEAALAAAIGGSGLALGSLPSMVTGSAARPAWLAMLANRLPKSAKLVAASAVVVAVAAIGGWVLARFVAPIGSQGAAGVLAGLQVIGLPLAPAAKPISGKASALGGDMLRVGEVTVRLAGVDAPDAEQPCGAVGKKSKRCGEIAREALSKLVRGKLVSCTLAGSDESGHSLASCHAEGTDVAATLVRQGHVFAQSGLLARYGSAEIEARTAKAGLWKTEVQRPADWRAKRWDEAKRAAPDGCPIKGAVNPDGKIYVLPWSRDYERTRVRSTRGERWFCSEQEARAAGWRAAERS